MTDTRRYTEGKSYEELLEIQKNSVIGGDVHGAVSLEIQRIQQDTNNIQISKLIQEIQHLKEIVDTNAKSTNYLAKVAIVVAVIAVVVQMLLSVVLRTL